jgi:hypothetical protein
VRKWTQADAASTIESADRCARGRDDRAQLGGRGFVAQAEHAGAVEAVACAQLLDARDRLWDDKQRPVGRAALRRVDADALDRRDRGPMVTVSPVRSTLSASTDALTKRLPSGCREASAMSTVTTPRSAITAERSSPTAGTNMGARNRRHDAPRSSPGTALSSTKRPALTSRRAFFRFRTS